MLRLAISVLLCFFLSISSISLYGQSAQQQILLGTPTTGGGGEPTFAFAHGSIQWLSADTAGSTYVVSSLAFTPKAVAFFTNGLGSATDAANNTNSGRRSFGVATSTSSRRVVATGDVDGAAPTQCSSGYRDDAVVLTLTTGAMDGLLDLTAIASNGFTLTVDDQVPADITVFWMAWGGTDITVAAVGDIAEPGSPGNQNISVTGFTADGANQAVIIAGVQTTGTSPSAVSLSSGFSLGFATGTGSTDQFVLMGASENAVATTDTDSASINGRVIYRMSTSGDTVNGRAALSAWGTDLFTLNWAEITTANRRAIFLALKGGNWKAGSYTINPGTVNNTASVSGLSFQPAGVLILGRGGNAVNADDGASNQDIFTFGAGSSTTSRMSFAQLSQTSLAAGNIGLAVEYDQVLVNVTGAGLVNLAYDISAIAADGFTIIVDTAEVGSSSTTWHGYFTFGD